MSKEMSDGQKVSSDTTNITQLLNSDGQNIKSVICRHCSCLILKPSHASYVEMTKELPSMTYHREKSEKRDILTKFWCVDDMFHFENMGFSNTVDDLKYLACAECDIGPLGWHNLVDKKCFVAIERIDHC